MQDLIEEKIASEQQEILIIYLLQILTLLLNSIAITPPVAIIHITLSIGIKNTVIKIKIGMLSRPNRNNMLPTKCNNKDSIRVEVKNKINKDRNSMAIMKNNFRIIKIILHKNLTKMPLYKRDSKLMI